MQFFCVLTMCDHSWQSINVKAVPALPLREVLIPLTVPTKYQIHKHCQNCESPERQKIYLKEWSPKNVHSHLDEKWILPCHKNWTDVETCVGKTWLFGSTFIPARVQPIFVMLTEMERKYLGSKADFLLPTCPLFFFSCPHCHICVNSHLQNQKEFYFFETLFPFIQ